MRHMLQLFDDLSFTQSACSNNSEGENFVYTGNLNDSHNRIKPSSLITEAPRLPLRDEAAAAAAAGGGSGGIWPMSLSIGAPW